MHCDQPNDVQKVLDGGIVMPPEGIALSRGPFGLGLITTHAVRAGEAIHRSDWFTVPDTERSFRVRTPVDGEIETLTITRLHSVKYGDTRTFDIPGCFMNDSCNPTSTSVDLVEEGRGEVTLYDQVALVDLAPGDAVTRDYTLFDWDCDGHQFVCACGSAGCYGRVAGFQGLPSDTQDRLRDRIYYASARMSSLINP
jgi:hypothetical protein